MLQNITIYSIPVMTDKVKIFVYGAIEWPICTIYEILHNFVTAAL